MMKHPEDSDHRTDDHQDHNETNDTSDEYYYLYNALVADLRCYRSFSSRCVKVVTLADSAKNTLHTLSAA
jgi:hypothetical protein